MPTQDFTVDIKAEVADSWADAVTYKPSNINYVVQYGSAGPCTIAFDIAMSDPLLTLNQFGPKRSEWRLNYGANVVNAGIITKTKPIPNDKVQVGGSDYLWYLDHRILPADYTTIETAYGGTIYVVTSVTVDSIINDLINLINATSDTLNIGTNFSGVFSTLDAFTVIPGDTTTILELIQQLAALDGGLGFEYYMTWDSGIPQLYVYADRYQVPPGIHPQITNEDIVGTPDWANNGPTSTVEIGFGINNLFAGQSIYAPSKTRFRLLENTQSYGDSFRTQAMVDAQVGSWGKINRSPQHDFTCTIDVEEYDLSLIFEHAGCVLNVDTDMFMPFHDIPGVDYRASVMSFNITNESQVLCDLTLEQAYLDGSAEV